MKFYQFSTLNKLANLEKGIKLYQPDITRQNTEAVLYSYADQLESNSDLDYKIDKTQNPETFNIRAKKIIPEWKPIWDVGMIQIIWGVVDTVFMVSVYEPDISNLERINEMTEFLPNSL